MNDVENFLAEREGQPAARSPATLGEVWSANFEAAGLSTASGVGKPFTQARSDIVTAIESAAEKSLGEFAREQGVRFGTAVTPEQNIDELRSLADRLPEDKRKAIEPLLDWRKRGAEKAAATERAAADVNANAYGLSPLAVRFAAGVARTTVDPLNLATMVMTAPIGGPAEAALLPFLGRQAVAGMVAQAVQEPAIQAGRAELGLASGPGEAAGNILEAGIGGAGFAALLRGGAAGLRLARAGLAGERPAALRPEAVQAQNAAGESLSPSHAPLAPADLDAAAHVAERDQMVAALAPDKPASPVDHATALADAAAALEEGRPIERPIEQLGEPPMAEKPLATAEPPPRPLSDLPLAEKPPAPAEKPAAAPGEAAAPAQKLGDPALAADAQRVMTEVPDLEIRLGDGPEAPRVLARDALAAANEDAVAARELAACVGAQP